MDPFRTASSPLGTPFGPLSPTGTPWKPPHAALPTPQSPRIGPQQPPRSLMGPPAALDPTQIARLEWLIQQLRPPRTPSNPSLTPDLAPPWPQLPGINENPSAPLTAEAPF